jgi:hypothetical protein
MNRGAMVALALTATLGCQKSSPPPPNPSGVTGTVGGAIAGVKGAVERTVTLNELNNLRLFIDTASHSGKMPTKAEVMAAAEREDKKLAAFLADGTIVMTGTKSREGVWAYVKDAEVSSGYVVTSTGIERKTAAELRQMLAANP